MGKIKQQRVAEQIRTLLSELLLFTVNDPRVQGITMTEVTIDRELQHADIKVNALGDEGRKDEVLAGLASAQSFLRRELGRRLSLRKVPQLHFHWDHSLEQALEINRLLDTLEIPDQPSEAAKDSEDQSETQSD
ncbi:MAG: 30S ribosome-binding factor RbfA [Ardenticatenaceae bacterium]|nr:30S ribosome-binding factor RbfA [Ardenticatenaceae bacterium]